jgi:hypothetical protein
MRAGLVVSLVGHIGAVLMTMLAWEASSSITAGNGAIVPIEIVTMAPEANVRALARAVEEEAEAPEIAEEAAEAVPAAGTAPTRRPLTPEQEYQRWLEQTQSQLNDTSKTRGEQQQRGETADTNRAGAGAGTGNEATYRDRAVALARAHLRRCWRMPADLPDPERLVVTVEFELNRNGTLNGQPRVTSPRNYTFDPAMRTAAEAALRAVRQCDPYPFPDDPIVGEHYQVWREQQLRFSVSF